MVPRNKYLAQFCAVCPLNQQTGSEFVFFDRRCNQPLLFFSFFFVDRTFFFLFVVFFFFTLWSVPKGL